MICFSGGYSGWETGGCGMMVYAVIIHIEEIDVS